MLRFLSERTAADRTRLADSLAQFMGDHPHELDMLRHDLTRFRYLPGGEFEGDFLPATVGVHRSWTVCWGIVR